MKFDVTKGQRWNKLHTFPFQSIVFSIFLALITFSSRTCWTVQLATIAPLNFKLTLLNHTKDWITLLHADHSVLSPLIQSDLWTVKKNPPPPRLWFRHIILRKTAAKFRVICQHLTGGILFEKTDTCCALSFTNVLVLSILSQRIIQAHNFPSSKSEYSIDRAVVFWIWCCCC